MATVKISELSAVTSLDDASIFPVVKSGTTYKVTTANLKGSVLAVVPGANVTGTLTNTVTGNITTVGTLGNLTVTSNVIAGNVIVGGGSGGNIAGANVITATTINTTALTANGAVNLGAVGNITITGGTSGYVLSTNGSGSLSWVAQSGGGGSYANSNVASYLPTYTGNITAGNVNAGNLITANYHSGNGSLLTSITGANVSGTVANATYAVNAGNAYSVTGSNVSGTVANATYATSAGSATTAATVTTAAQPNITSVGTLSSLTVTANVSGGNLTTTGTLSAGDAVISGNLTISGTTTTVNSTTTRIVDPIIELGGGSNGAALSSNSGKDVGQLLHYYTTGVVDAFMGWDNSNAEFAFGSNVSVANEVVTFNSLGNVRASTFIGTLSGAATTAGTVTTAAQPNITSHGTLTGLASGGTVNFTTSSNVSLGPVANVHITGGTSGYVLSTDGSGTLSWVAQSASSSYGDSNVGSYLANYSGNLSAANLTVSSVPNFSSTGYMLVPKGSTAQRPGSGVAGYVRYNTDLGVLECYNAQGAWQPAGGYKHVTVSSSTYTASSWDFCWTDTSSAAITITLPSSPVKGDTIRFVDVANNFGTNNLTISRNGQKVQGDTTDMTVTVSGAAFDLIYFNATYGWRVFSV
jgi:hypothetical protein